MECEPEYFILPTRWDFDSESCQMDFEAIIPLTVLALVLWPASLLWAICARTVHCRFKIVDVYTESSGNQKNVLIRTLNDISGREQLHYSGKSQVPVEFIEAEHPSLEHNLKPEISSWATLNLAYYRLCWMMTGGRDLPKMKKAPESNNVFQVLTKDTWQRRLQVSSQKCCKDSTYRLIDQDYFPIGSKFLENFPPSILKSMGFQHPKKLFSSSLNCRNQDGSPWEMDVETSTGWMGDLIGTGVA